MIGLPVLAGLDGKAQQGKVRPGARDGGSLWAGALGRGKSGPLKPLSPLDRLDTVPRYSR